MSEAIGDHWVGRLGLLILVLLALRTLLVYRATGRFPIHGHDTETAHGFNQVAMAVAAVGFAVNLLLLRLPNWLSFKEGHRLADVYSYTAPIQMLQSNEIRLLGLALACLALAYAALAQHQMGSSWRFGLDSAHKTELVTDGLFKSSRHPIYFGFLMLGIGLFLAMPSTLTAVAAAILAVALSIQTRLEEEFMLEQHGDAYSEYLARTRRWV